MATVLPSQTVNAVGKPSRSSIAFLKKGKGMSYLLISTVRDVIHLLIILHWKYGNRFTKSKS